MKFLLKLSLLLAGLLLTIYIAIGSWLKTAQGAKMLTSLIAESIEQSLDHRYKIELQDIKFSFPSALELGKVNISDSNGQFLTTKNICLNIFPSLLWPWKITIWNLSAEKLILTRMPNKREDSNQRIQYSNDITKFIPEIELQSFVIDQLLLASDITGLDDDVALNLTSVVAFHPTEQIVRFSTTLTADTSVTLLQNGYLELFGNFDVKKQKLDIENFQVVMTDTTRIQGKLAADFLENIVTGRASYESLLLKHLLQETTTILGPLSGEVELSGAINTPVIKINGQLLLEQIDRKLPTIYWQSEVAFNDDGFKGRVAMNANSLKATGEITREESKFFLKNFTIKGNNLTSNINLAFNSKESNLLTDIVVNSKNISELNVFWPLIHKGSIDVKAKYSASLSGPKVLSILGKVRNLSTTIFTCEMLDIDASVEDLSKLKVNHASIKIRFLSRLGNVLKNFTFETKRQIQDQDSFVEFNSAIDSLHPYVMNLKINGKIGIEDNANKKISVTSNINGYIGKNPITTSEALKILFDQNKMFTILAPHIKVGDGKLSLNCESNSGAIKGKLEAKALPISLLPYLLPYAFNGAVASGQAQIDGKADLLQMTSSFEIHGIYLRHSKKNGTKLPITMKGFADLKDQFLLLDLSFFDNSKVLGKLHSKIPYRLSLTPFESSFSTQEKMNVSLSLNEESNILSLMPLPSGHRLQGYIRGNLDITGSLDEMLVNGKIFIKNSEYQYQPYGIRLKNIETNIIAKGQNIKMTDFITKDVYGNSIKGSGVISLGKNMPFKFQFITDKFDLINTPYVQGQLAGNLNFSGNNQRSLVNGSFELGPMEIKIPERFSDDVPEVNIVDPSKEEKQETKLIKKESYILELDIDLAARKQVYVRGWGVSTLLTGNLKVTGDLTDPRIFGRLTSNHGRYQEFGKILTVKEGVLEFSGSISPSPYLHIVGVTMVNSTEIRLILSGSIFHPDIAIASTPALSQENALSLLLFGKNPDSISTIQALTLANSMRKLSGHGGGFDLAEFGKKIIPVDDIRFNRDEYTKSNIIGIGKYLTDKVYIEIEQGDQVAGTKTKVEIELTPKFSLEGITSEKEGSSLGVNWHFDY